MERLFMCKLFANCFVAFACISSFPIRADILVTSQTAPTENTILRYSGTGSFVGTFASGHGLADPLGMAYGPDGNLYVASGQNNLVLRFEGNTGTFIGVFASGNGLEGPINLTFGPDGNLYVSSGYDHILRFNGTTGAFIDAFVSGGRLAFPRGLTFGPDGNLYVVNYNLGEVLRYNGTTGAFMDAFVPAGLGGLYTPDDLAFGPDGNLYVSGGVFGSVGVRRYDGLTGAFINLFAAFPDNTYPIDLAFGPDQNLYVVSQGGIFSVMRFDGHTGSFIDYFVTDGSGGLSNPFGIAFVPARATNQPPTVSCSGGGTVECGTATVAALVNDADGDALTVVWTLNGATSQTNNIAANKPGPTTTNVVFSANMPPGTNSVCVSVTDGSSNLVVCSTAVVIIENPPSINSAHAEPPMLRPPDHKMVAITVKADASTACGAATWRIIDVRSNESADGAGDGHTSTDWLITGDHTVSLRAERSGRGRGRVYSILIQATDSSGNVSSPSTVTVSVPK